MLSCAEELKPVFARFGIAEISDILDLELRGIKRRPRSIKSQKEREDPVQLSRMTTTYHPLKAEENNLAGYILPRIRLHQGTVMLDGVAQHRAVVDSKTRTIRWTRQVPDHGYEQGRVRILSHGKTGSGAILLSENPHQSETPPSDGPSKIIRFHVAKPSASNFKHCSDEQGKPQQPPSLNNTVFLADEEAAGDADDGDDDSWTLVIDRDLWNQDEKKDQASSPITIGEIILTTYHSGGASGMSVPIVKIPILDKLCTQINQVYHTQKPIESLYSSTMKINAKGRQMYTVILDKAPLLYNLADKEAGGDIKRIFNITFHRALKSDIELPMLFRTLVAEVMPGAFGMRGAALEYDSKRRGSDGPRSDARPFSSTHLIRLSGGADIFPGILYKTCRSRTWRYPRS